MRIKSFKNSYTLDIPIVVAIFNCYLSHNCLTEPILFIIAIIAVSIIITTFYNLNKNIIIAILIHQQFNFFGGIITGDRLQCMIYTVLLYVVIAGTLIFINPKEVLYKKKYI